MERDYYKFEELGAKVLAISVDSVPSHDHFAAECGLEKLPLLSDFLRDVSRDYGVLRPEGHSERATFIVDKKGIIRWKQVVDLGHQRDNDEILRALRQSLGGLQGGLSQ